ncbi:MAG TPA: hypothetical protein VKX49_23710 [Bryobacteraceae bacterium]|nr:hypothetical protein [Bryobacteraceae bacterium]
MMIAVTPMKRRARWKPAICVLALTFAGLAFADLNQTNVLVSGTTINLDTGVVGSSGGDIQWTASGITPQGNATALHIYSNWPISQFDSISIILISGLAAYYSKATIPPDQLKVGDVFGVHTNGGHWAKVIVTATSSASITVRFTTFGVAGGPGTGNSGPPTITAVVNNSSTIPGGLPNSGIAPSSIFAVIGSGLADAGLPALQDTTGGLPLSLHGASISVTVGGSTTHPAIYYTSPGQIAGVLPAATPVGAGTLTVTYNGTASNAFPIMVVPAAPGINYYYTNSGVATDNGTGAVLTYANSGTPGQNIVLWTTGLGADPADSDTTYTSSPHAVNTPLQVYIGGMPATVLYQGSAGYPGVDQINVTIPASVPNGCWISVVAVAGGVLSNTATLPINSGGGACVDPVSGLSGNQIAPPSQHTLRTGLVTLIQGTSSKNVVTTSAAGAFESYSGVFGPANSVSPGGCIVQNLTATPDFGAITGLDPGGINLAGPGGVALTLAKQGGIKGAFTGSLAPGAIPQAGGTFTFTATGGADVGSFTSVLTFTNPLLSWTNPNVAASINRSQGFTVTWTGGNPGSIVFVTGTSTSAATANNPSVTAGFTCMANVADQQLTVPAYILSALPAGTGAVSVHNMIYLPLSASGIDIGLTGGEISQAASSIYK